MKLDATPSSAPRVWPLALLAAGLVVSAAAGLWQQRSNEAQVQAQLEMTAERMADRLRRRMQLYENGLLATRSAILTAGRSAEEITRDQFHRYGASLDMARQLPGVNGVSFIRRVPVGREAAFVAGMRREGFPDFRIHQVSPHLGERFVMQYMEPLQGSNLQALGLDIASDPPRRAAALAALRSSEPRLSAPFALEDDPNRRLRAFALMVPVYRSVTVPPPEQRDAEAFGWASVRLVMDEMLQDFDLEGGAVALALSDATPPSPGASFFTSPDWQPDTRAPVRLVPLQLYGRVWQVQVQALPPLVQRLHQRDPLGLALRSAVTAALLALLLHALLVAAQRDRVILYQQARMAALVDSAHDAIVGQSVDGAVLTWNPAAERLLGWREGEVLGRDLVVLTLPPEGREPMRQALQRVRQGQDVPPFDTLCLDREGRPVAVSASVACIRDTRGQPSGAATTLRDMRAQRAAQARIEELNATLERALEQRTLQAQAASQAKSTFLAHMGHEFHTPLNAVLGFSQLLAQMDLPPRAQEFVRLVRQAGEQLLGLTDAVLELSRLEAGELHLEHAAFGLAALVEDVAAAVRPPAQRKGLLLRVELAPGLPPQLRGDAPRLRQVLLKLLDNAVKFTEAGSVGLRVVQAGAGAGTGADHSDGRVWLRFEVSDTGIGMEPQVQQRIFEPFAQGDDSSTRRFGGTGMGLSIARRLVALMGGELSLDSTPGRGSSFSVVLPMEVGDGGTAPPQRTA